MLGGFSRAMYAVKPELLPADLVIVAPEPAKLTLMPSVLFQIRVVPLAAIVDIVAD